jgi:hypothetical protein
MSRQRTGGTDSASYCYQVWLKHLTILWANGLREIPNTVAELGPGDSLGTGLAALLSGVEHYYALDVVKYANVSRNLIIFDQLVEMFRCRARGATSGWPPYDQYLDADMFPSHILTDILLQRALAADRVAAIRRELAAPGLHANSSFIKYCVPWQSAEIIQPCTVDLIFSHSVLECVIDLPLTYRACATWLKAGGWMSHQIDFTSIGYSKKWNGHWTFSELMWKITTGKRPYAINRQPISAHLRFLQNVGFEVVTQMKRLRSDGINRSQLACAWRELSDEDLSCSGAFIQAITHKSRSTTT